MSEAAVIVNADDLGMTEDVTRDILTCFDAGRITSATIMANGDAFETACEGVHRLGLAHRVGVHLNLTSGRPLTTGMRSYCDGSGYMRVPFRRLFATPSALAAIMAELRAQIGKVVAAGLKPSHIDSHHHIINSWPYARIALRVAREFGISRVRLTRNAFYQHSPGKTVFKALFNRYLRQRGFVTTRWFTDVKPYITHIEAGGAPLPGVVELMTHPGDRLAEPVCGAETETQLLLCDAFGDFLRRSRPISFAELTQ